jgi:hypothetical protein
MYPVKDCQCEDFPCCEHADNFPETEPQYCEECGVMVGPNHNCQDYIYDPEEDEDE